MNYKLFENVLNQIERKDIRDFTIACLKDAPDFLDNVPASVSGKYHPEEATKQGGLVWHVKRACWFANMFFGAFKWGVDNIRTDIILSALLLHDIGKQESYGKDYFKYVNHPLTAGKMIEKHKNMIPEKVFKIIQNCVHQHMHVFGPKSIVKNTEDLNICELIVYQCDYLSSKKDLKII